jgi:hypothetical protein
MRSYKLVGFEQPLAEVVAPIPSPVVPRFWYASWVLVFVIATSTFKKVTTTWAAGRSSLSQAECISH